MNAEAGNALLEGNDLPMRWRGRPAFVILSTAFGDGREFPAFIRKEIERLLDRHEFV